MGMRSGDVKGLDAAVAAEIVLRHLGVECVGAESVLALQNLEPGSRQDQPQKTRLAADGAITLGHENILGCAQLEAHSAAMASAAVLDHSNAPVFSTT
jgi:hypothetical protein